MKTIEAYKTSDGQVFENKELATKHEQKTLIDIELRHFLNRKLDYTETQAQNLSNDIINNLDDFKKIINQ